MLINIQDQILTSLLSKILPRNLNLASLISFLVATGGWATRSFIEERRLRCDDNLLCSCSLETGSTTWMVGLPSLVDSLRSVLTAKSELPISSWMLSMLVAGLRTGGTGNG